MSTQAIGRVQPRQTFFFVERQSVCEDLGFGVDEARGSGQEELLCVRSCLGGRSR